MQEYAMKQAGRRKEKKNKKREEMGKRYGER